MKIKMVTICGKVMRKRASKKHAQKAQKRMLKTLPGDLPEASQMLKSTPKGASGETSVSPNYFFRDRSPLGYLENSLFEILLTLWWRAHSSLRIMLPPQCRAHCCSRCGAVHFLFQNVTVAVAACIFCGIAR